MNVPSKARVNIALAVLSLFATRLAAQAHEHPTAPVAPSPEAQQAFSLVKSLAGAWQGAVVEPTSKLNVNMDVTIRVTSRGNSVVHEVSAAEATENPIRNDHPVSMMYLDAGKLLLTHYCDAGNRPRMSARVSPDGKVIDFDFIDLTGPTKYGHMQHARFTLIDPTHHIEDWTYELPDGKTVIGHFDLKRVSEVATITAK